MAMTKKCLRCKEKGHIAKDCPNREKDQADAFFVRVTLSNRDTEIVQQTPIKSMSRAKRNR